MLGERRLISKKVQDCVSTLTPHLLPLPQRLGSWITSTALLKRLNPDTLDPTPQTDGRTFYQDPQDGHNHGPPPPFRFFPASCLFNTQRIVTVSHVQHLRAGQNLSKDFP
jgi:hypothetical protein